MIIVSMNKSHNSLAGKALTLKSKSVLKPPKSISQKPLQADFSQAKKRKTPAGEESDSSSSGLSDASLDPEPAQPSHPDQTALKKAKTSTVLVVMPSVVWGSRASYPRCSETMVETWVTQLRGI